jgi:hypothetical protein
MMRAIPKRCFDAFPLAVFRIVFALAIFCEVAQLVRFRHLIFDAVPFIQPARFDVLPLLCVWLAILVALICGVATRLAAALNVVLTVAVFGFLLRVQHFGYHADAMYIPGAILLALVPSERVFSIDAWRAARVGQPMRRDANAIHFAAFAMLLAITYGDSFFWKLASPMWRHGLAIWTPVAELFACVRLPPLPPQPLLWKAMSYGTLIFEGAFPIVIWFRRIRVPVIVAGIAMHLGIAYLFPIPLFSLVMISLYLPLIPAKAYGLPEAAREMAPAWRERAVAGLLGIWLLAALVLLTRIPPLPSSRVGGRPFVFVAKVLSLIGARSHDVYLDGHFVQPQPTMLVFESGGRRLPLPYTQPTGLTGPDLSGRTYSTWIWIATMSGDWVADGSRVIRRYAAFWLGDQRMNLAGARIVIYRRRFVHPRDVEVEVLRENQAAQWYEAGEIAGSDLHITWKAVNSF